jgi:hypothetical protein
VAAPSRVPFLRRVIVRAATRVSSHTGCLVHSRPLQSHRPKLLRRVRGRGRSLKSAKGKYPLVRTPPLPLEQPRLLHLCPPTRRQRRSAGTCVPLAPARRLRHHHCPRLTTTGTFHFDTSHDTPHHTMYHAPYTSSASALTLPDTHHPLPSFVPAAR